MTRHLALGAFFHPTGHHIAAWRDEGAQFDAGTNIDHYLDLARAAEAVRSMATMSAVSARETI